MITLSEFFEINQEIVLFAYGLVFFILGIAIMIRTRQSSRLELARSLQIIEPSLLAGCHPLGMTIANSIFLANSL